MPQSGEDFPKQISECGALSRWSPVYSPTAVELSQLRRTWSAEFIPLPADLHVPRGGGLKSALLNSTAVPLTPPRRGTGQPGLLPSWEGLGVGSGAQCAHNIRGSLSLAR